MDNVVNQGNRDRLGLMDNQDPPDREESLVLRDQADPTVSFVKISVGTLYRDDCIGRDTDNYNIFFWITLNHNRPHRVA